MATPNALGNLSPLLTTPSSGFGGVGAYKTGQQAQSPNYAGAIANFFSPVAPKMPTGGALPTASPFMSGQNPGSMGSPFANAFGALGNAMGGKPYAPISGMTNTNNSPMVATQKGGVMFHPPAAQAAAGAPPPPTGASPTVGAPAGTNVGATDPNAGLAYNQNAGYNISTNDIGSGAVNSNTSMNDLKQTRSQYAEYLQGLYNATIPSQDYLDAMKQYQDAKQMQMQISADYYTNPNYPGDTLGFAQGTQGRQTALNALQQNAAANALNVQQTIRQGNIDAFKSLSSGYAPQTVGIGASLVSGASGDVAYQSPYLYKPTAGSIDTVAQQLLQSGQASNYADAYNMAQQVVVSSAQGQQGFAPGQATPSSSSPVYQNAYTLLSQGVPFSSVLSSTGRSATGRAMAQLALSDFLKGNSGYNAQQATANAKAAVDLGVQGANVSRAIDTADANFQLLLNLADKAGINDHSSPIRNQLDNALSRKVLGSGDINQFDTGIQTLRTEYAQILARGGQVTDAVRGEANSIIPDNISLDNLNKVYSYIHSEGTNVVKGYDDQVKKLTNPISGSRSGTSGAGGVDVSAYAF